MGPSLYRQMLVDSLQAALENARAVRTLLGPSGARLHAEWLERARDAARELTSVRLSPFLHGPEERARDERDQEGEPDVGPAKVPERGEV